MASSDLLIRHLPFFTVAAEEENFQRAAARLNVTQPALSRRMQDLEAGLGVPLFERSRGRIHLTGEGQAFAAEARRIMDSFGGMVKEMRRAASNAPRTLAIGFNEHSMRISALTAALRSFRDARPDINVTVTLMNSAPQLAALRSGQLDIAILYLDPEQADSVGSQDILQPDPYVVALPDQHPLADRVALKLADLAGEDLIWPSNEHSPALYADLAGAWRGAGVEPHVTTEIASAEAALNAVSAGLGIAVVRASNHGREPHDVVLREVDDLQVDTRVSVAWNAEGASSQTRAFLDHLRRAGVIQPMGTS